MPTNTAINLSRTYVEDAALPARRESAFALVRHLLSLPESIAPNHRKEALSMAIWKWTEAEGVAPHAKFHVRMRSLRAIDLSHPASVNHEHVWPRKWIVDRLLAQGPWSDEDLLTFLEEYAVACTVTVEEHARLGAARGTGWARYAEAGVEVWDMLEDRAFVLPADQGRDVAEPLDEAPADAQDELTKVTAGISPAEAVTAMGGARADMLRALLSRLEREDVVVAVGTTRKPDRPIGDYLRIHDNALEEPSAAVAYLHWNGRLSLRLLTADVPSYLALPEVRPTNHRSYGVETRLTSSDDLDVAEALIELALEKVRSW